MSKEWIKEHEKIQKLNLSEHGIENDGHPRAIAALQFWSDSTHLADFGQAKAWPIYLAFGNQSSMTVLNALGMPCIILDICHR